MNIKINGKNVNIRTGGVNLDKKNKALILLHGAGMDGSIWQLQTRYLANKGIRSLAIDLPGHGFSDPPTLKSIKKMSNWCIKVLKHLKIKSAVVVGHSMGSLVALEMAKTEKNIIKAISLLGTSHVMPVHPELIKTSKNDINFAAELMVDWSLSKKQHLGDNPTPGYWMIGSSSRLIKNSPKGTLYDDLNACNNYIDAILAAKNIKQKVKIISGNEDKMTPVKNAKNLAKNIHDVDIKILNETGHMMMVEQPKSTAKELFLFASTYIK